MTTMGAARAALSRAEGVELIGEMAGSGYRVPPSLVRRSDGQTVQLTPLLYAVLHEIDGRKTAEEVAEAVSASTGRSVNADNISHFVDEQLRPLGLLTRSDGSQPVVRKRNPLLGLRFRYTVSDPDRTRKLTDPFRVLFRPWVVTPALVAFGVICWWVLFVKGFASATADAFQRPGLLILVFAVTVVSAGFHEFGHAAAARYGGATPGVMGFGLYLVWPAFYTDVTDSYRLGRRGRIRTDLGGLYFNALVAIAIIGLWAWRRDDALLLVVATQIVQMLRQLAPLVRFDGYHVLADITGVPDLYSRIKPTLLGALPWRWGDPAARLLKPWARIVVTVWVLVVVPLLLATLLMAVWALPRVLGSAWAGLNTQRGVLAAAWSDGDVVQIVARVLAMIAIVIPVAGVLYMLARLVRRTSAGTWKATAGKPAMRALAMVAGAAVIAGIGYAWWPHGSNYRPIQPWERGTIGDIMYALATERVPAPLPDRRDNVASPRLVRGDSGIMRVAWDTRAAMPTAQKPQLALVLVPKTSEVSYSGGGGGGAVTTAPGNGDDGWVFPVNKPLAPEPGDTQALAINTTDGTTTYEAAFAMVWVTDNSDALNVNEAQAYASCDSCTAVAVAYQVVFVIDSDPGDDNVVAPQNLAGALSYECVNCMTYALARQLFITLDEPLSDDAMRRLDTLWGNVAQFERDIEAGTVPPEEIEARLDGYTKEVIAIVAADQPGAIPSTTASSVAATTSTSPTTSTLPAPSTTATSAPPTTSTSNSPTAISTPKTTTQTDPTTTKSSASSSPTETATDEPMATGDATAADTAGDTTDSGTSADDGTP